MAKEIKTRKIRSEDVPQIIAIQEAIIKKRVSRRWVQMVEEHLRETRRGWLCRFQGWSGHWLHHWGGERGRVWAGAERLD